MKFQAQLNAYIQQLDCLAKELSTASGISAATLSRYRSGERLPDPNAPVFGQLCQGIARLAAERGLTEVTEEAVRAAFFAAEDFAQADTEQLMRNFDLLLSMLDISVSKLCRQIHYDPSTIVRFRNGSRRPAEPERFAAAVASSIVRERDTPQDMAVLASLLQCPADALADVSVRFDRLRNWLLNGQVAAVGKEDISGFLTKLDEFDLNEYIQAIHFDQLKVPSAPFQLPSSKSYFGLAEMMDSELDFLKATILSKSQRPVTMYSDMPMTEMAKDPFFPKKWMFGMAMLLKKGLHLNQIHNLERSFEEMMLGLEVWIPMYMTGQISPYYIKNTQSSPFLHLLKVSGAAALSGEAIAGHHSQGRYYLTKARREVAYYSRQAQALLDNASPLMEIYRGDRANEFNAFLLADAPKSGKRRGILSSPPLYTMERETLTAFLDARQVAKGLREDILHHAAAQRQRVETILETEQVEDEVSSLSQAEFDKHPPALDVSGAFCESDLCYTYPEYVTHLQETARFAAAHPNYTLKRTAAQAFRNLQIFLREGQWAMVSKGKAPAIHFVIRHPRLREAMEQFIPPVVE